MKTIFITIYDGAISKNILRTDVFRILKRHCRVVLFVSPVKYDYHVEHFAGPNVHIEKIPQATHPWIEQRLILFSLHNLHTNTIRIKVHHFFHKNGGHVSKFAKLLLWQLGRLRWMHSVIRALYYIVPDHSFDAFFDTYKPDLVFAPNIIANVDYRMIKQARKRGVVSVGLPKGWDNLSAKTFFLIFPDHLLLQNEAMSKEAMMLYRFPQERIHVVGFPNFDMYARKNDVISRERFYSSLGLDPNKKTILYAVAGDALAPHDEEVFNDLVREIERRPELKSRIQIHARPHPKYKFRAAFMTRAPYVTIDDPGVKIGEKRSSWEFRDEDILHLMNSLYHADMLICTLSTLSIESAIFDVPVISIAYDGPNVINPYLSVSRYYEYSHMIPLVHSGGILAVRSSTELIEAVSAYANDRTLHREGRWRAVELYVGQCDGKAGERIAEFMLGLVGERETS